MTVHEIKKRVEHIKTITEDFEAAHNEEDMLYQDVLTAIAEGAENPQDLAKAALVTTKIDFERYCA